MCHQRIPTSLKVHCVSGPCLCGLSNKENNPTEHCQRPSVMHCRRIRTLLCSLAFTPSHVRFLNGAGVTRANTGKLTYLHEPCLFLLNWLWNGFLADSSRSPVLNSICFFPGLIRRSCITYFFATHTSVVLDTARHGCANILLWKYTAVYVFGSDWETINTVAKE